MEGVPERGRVRAKGTESAGIGMVLAGGGGEVEMERERGGLGAKSEEGEGRVVLEGMRLTHRIPHTSYSHGSTCPISTNKYKQGSNTHRHTTR